MQQQQYTQHGYVAAHSSRTAAHVYSFPATASIEHGAQHQQQPGEAYDSLPPDAQTHRPPPPPRIAQHMTRESRMMSNSPTPSRHAEHPHSAASTLNNSSSSSGSRDIGGFVAAGLGSVLGPRAHFANAPVTISTSSDPALAFTGDDTASRRRTAGRDPSFYTAAVPNDTVHQPSALTESSPASRVLPTGYQLPPIMLSSTDTQNPSLVPAPPSTAMLPLSYTSGDATTVPHQASGWPAAHHHSFPPGTTTPALSAHIFDRNTPPNPTSLYYSGSADEQGRLPQEHQHLTTKRLPDLSSAQNDGDAGASSQQPRHRAISNNRAIIIDTLSEDDSDHAMCPQLSRQRRRRRNSAAVTTLSSVADSNAFQTSVARGDDADEEGSFAAKPASRASGLAHLVSPRAIREAERQEREVAMRGTRHEHPFSAFPSFMSMKHLQEDEIKAYYHHRAEKETAMAALQHASLSPNTTESSSCSSPSSPVLSPPSGTSVSGGPQHVLPTTATLGSPQAHQRRTAAPSDSLTSGSTDTSTQSPPIQPKERLKRPPNGYLLFNRDMRRKLLERSPKLTVAEISKEIGDMWKRLPEHQREWYMQRAALIKQDHIKNHPGFIYHRRSKAEIAEARRLAKRRRSLPANNNSDLGGSSSVIASKGNWMVSTAANTVVATDSSNDPVVQQQQQQQQRRKSDSRRRHPQSTKAVKATRDPRGRKKKRHRHPEAPKHPMSGFLFFLSAMRPQVALQYPGYPVGPISQIIARQWRGLTDSERIPWLQKAEEDKARYAQEMQVYNANLERGSVAGQQQQQQQRVASAAPVGYSSSSPSASSAALQSSFFAPSLLPVSTTMAAPVPDRATTASKYPQQELAW